MTNNTVTSEAIAERITLWIENARRNIRNIAEEMSNDSVNPQTLAAQMSGHFEKIEAWNEVLRVMGYPKA